MVDVRLIHGSALHIPLDDETVQTCVTSPPYWGLRQYAGEQSVPEWGCALGLEPTPELYVEHMVEVFREVRRVLRRDGTLWLNLGDSYAANRSYQVTDNKHVDVGNNGGMRVPPDLKPKDLVGIPWMVAFALRADGWWLRSDVIWHKPNPMPESVTDRPTKAHEYLFLLTKSEWYYYDADAIREPAAWERWGDQTVVKPQPGTASWIGNAEKDALQERTTRNKRTVWTIPTRPYPGAHFATFPEELVRDPILAGSSPKACGVCGAPWERVKSKRGASPEYAPLAIESSGALDERGTHRNMGGRYQKWLDENPVQTLGWRSTCEHEDDSGACVVLDPFNGSGTTGRVAVRHGRSYVGVDISKEYLDEQAVRRVYDVQIGIGL